MTDAGRRSDAPPRLLSQVGRRRTLAARTGPAGSRLACVNDQLRQARRALFQPLLGGRDQIHIELIRKAQQRQQQLTHFGFELRTDGRQFRGALIGKALQGLLQCSDVGCQFQFVHCRAAPEPAIRRLCNPWAEMACCLRLPTDRDQSRILSYRIPAATLLLFAAATAGATADAGRAPPSPLPAPTQISLSINGRQVTVVATALNESELRDIMQHVGVSAVPPAQPRQRGGLRARCTVEGDTTDPVVARLELHCEGWHVVFVRLCPQRPCRYGLVSRQYLPRKR